MHRIQFTILLILIFTLKNLAQDTQYTQFQNVPLTVSPALTGLMKGSFRMTSNVRRQWTSLSNTEAWDQAYVAVDYRKCFSQHFIAFGIQTQADEIGPVLSQLKISGNLAYHHKVMRHLYISGGFSGGILNYRLGQNEMTFDSQFGVRGFDSTLPSLEDFEVNNRTVMDLSMGLLLYNTERAWSAGFALHHINQPTYSFLGEEKNRLGVGLTVHASWTTNISNNEKRKLVFRGLYRRQSTIENSRQWYSVLGVTWLYNPAGNNTGFTFGLGLSGRISGHFNQQFAIVDAILPNLSIGYENWLIGLSYDLNTSSARKETHLRGGWEISLIWKFTGETGCVWCPNF